MNDGPPKRRSGLHIFALWAIAVAQPVLDLLGNNATFFVAHRASRLWIVVFALVVVFAVPFLLVLLVRIVAIGGKRAADVLHLAIVAGLIAAIIVPPLMRVLGLGAPLTATLFIAIAIAGAWAYRRLEPVRRLTTILVVAPVFVLVAFLFFSQSRDLVFAKTGSSGGGAKEKVDTPVVMLGLDELALGSILRPDGTIDASRFPNFARLATRSTWYPNATTVAQTTEYAFPAILSGKRPSGKRKLPVAEQHPDNLFSLLKGSMPIHATEFVTDICPGSTCGDDGTVDRLALGAMLKDAGVVYLHYALPADVAERSLPALTGRWAGFSDGKDTGRRSGRKAHRERIAGEMESSQRERFERARNEISASEAPALWYIHLGLPHAPWRYLASGQQYDGDTIPGVGAHEAWNDQYQLVEHGLQRYLLQLSFADRIVGDLLDRLQETELLDESLLMVFADHGVAFGSGNRRLLDGKNTAEIISVPLFIKYPGQAKGTVDEGNVETVDILPTVADVAGVEVPWKVDGVSLRNGAPDRARKSVMAHRKERTLTFPAVIPQIDEASRRIERLFGKGGSPYDIYAWGPHRDLVGTEPGSSTRAEGSAVQADMRPYASVDPSSGFVPARFNAVLEGVDADEPRWVAVTLNGRIAGLGQTYLSEVGTTQVSMMLAPGLFEKGSNEVEVYLIGPGSRLAALT